jgi:hypothetical protein
MNASRWWPRLALASGLTIGAFALSSVPAQAAPSGPTTLLAGNTSQAYPSYFRIAAAGKSVVVGAIALNVSCGSGATFSTPDAVTHLRIGPGGSVHAQFTFPPTALSSGGGTYTGTDSMSATFNRKRTRVTGVWEMQLSYTFADGTTDQCESGPVRFTDVS